MLKCLNGARPLLLYRWFFHSKAEEQKDLLLRPPSFLTKHTHSPTQSPTHSSNQSGRCPAPYSSFTVCVRAVSNCTLNLIGSAVQCAAVKDDKSFFYSLEKCLPAELLEDTGHDNELIASRLLFRLSCNCEDPHWWCSLEPGWFVCLHPLWCLCGTQMWGPHSLLFSSARPYQGFPGLPLSLPLDLTL